MKTLLFIVGIAILGGVVYAAYFFLYGNSLPHESEIESFYIVYSEGRDIGTSEFEIKDPIKISELRNIIGDLRVPRLPIPTQEIPDESNEQWMINIFFNNGDQRYIPVYKGEPNNRIYEFFKENYI